MAAAAAAVRPAVGSCDRERERERAKERVRVEGVSVNDTLLHFSH